MNHTNNRLCDQIDIFHAIEAETNADTIEHTGEKSGVAALRLQLKKENESLMQSSQHSTAMSEREIHQSDLEHKPGVAADVCESDATQSSSKPDSVASPNMEDAPINYISVSTAEMETLPIDYYSVAMQKKRNMPDDYKPASFPMGIPLAEFVSDDYYWDTPDIIEEFELETTEMDDLAKELYDDVMKLYTASIRDMDLFEESADIRTGLIIEEQRSMLWAYATILKVKGQQPISEAGVPVQEYLSLLESTLRLMSQIIRPYRSLSSSRRSSISRKALIDPQHLRDLEDLVKFLSNRNNELWSMTTASQQESLRKGLKGFMVSVASP